jgi:hypothetical protein
MRFYEKVLSKPIPVGILVLGFILLNPFHIPPDPVAKAVEVVKVEAPVLVERTPEASKVYAKTQLSKFGWDTPAQWECLIDLWTRESNWRPNAYNKTPVYQNGEKLHAGGIPQILGLDPDISVERQIERGLVYVESRYGSPCSAWRFWTSHYWY